MYARTRSRDVKDVSDQHSDFVLESTRPFSDLYFIIVEPKYVENGRLLGEESCFAAADL